MAELKTGYVKFKQMAAPRKRSYAKITQKHLFSTAVSSLDILKQSNSGFKTIQQCGHHINTTRAHIWDRGSKWDFDVLLVFVAVLKY